MNKQYNKGILNLIRSGILLMLALITFTFFDILRWFQFYAPDIASPILAITSVFFALVGLMQLYGYYRSTLAYYHINR